MYYPGTKRKMMDTVIKGTTFTGHPIRTTFGNTMRMLFYAKYIKYMSKIDNIL